MDDGPPEEWRTYRWPAGHGCPFEMSQFPQESMCLHLARRRKAGYQGGAVEDEPHWREMIVSRMVDWMNKDERREMEERSAG